MTQEEKQLLIKDICARLPYGVKLGFENSDLILVPEEFNVYTKQLSTNQIYPKSDKVVIGHIYNVWNYRPYLRPMSSMTDEEETLFRCELPAIAKTDAQLVAMRMELFLKGHLDFNHLIEKGLALEAPEGMYKI
jgi:hypothetical protein